MVLHGPLFTFTKNKTNAFSLEQAKKAEPASESPDVARLKNVNLSMENLLNVNSDLKPKGQTPAAEPKDKPGNTVHSEEDQELVQQHIYAVMKDFIQPFSPMLVTFVLLCRTVGHPSRHNICREEERTFKM